MQDARWTLILSPNLFLLLLRRYFVSPHRAKMSDIKGIKLRQMTTPEQQDKKIRDVAQQYEKHFLRELVKSMRSTVSDGGLVEKSQAEKIFSEQLDEQYVDQWGNSGGIGLADMIHKQMLEKFGVQLGIKAPINGLRGPVPLQPRDKENLGFKTTQKPDGLEFKFKDLAKLSRDLTNPFDGTITGMEQLNGQSLLSIEHQNGFQSLLKFPTPMASPSASSNVPVTKIGDFVPAGQSLGQWASKLGDLDWEFSPVGIR